MTVRFTPVVRADLPSLTPVMPNTNNRSANPPRALKAQAHAAGLSRSSPWQRYRCWPIDSRIDGAAEACSEVAIADSRQLI